jgi:hypothetical protein
MKTNQAYAYFTLLMLTLLHLPHREFLVCVRCLPTRTFQIPEFYISSNHNPGTSLPDNRTRCKVFAGISIFDSRHFSRRLRSGKYGTGGHPVPRNYNMRILVLSLSLVAIAHEASAEILMRLEQEFLCGLPLVLGPLPSLEI